MDIHRVDFMTIGVLWEYPVEVIFISSMSSPSQLAFSFRGMPLSGLETTGWKGTTVTAGVPQIYSCWRTQLLQITHLMCFFLFRDFNDGRYPRYYEKNATTFWGPFSFRVVFCGEMLGIPKWVAFSRGFFWWFSGATAQRYQSHWKQAERAIELDRFHIRCDVCPRRKNTTSSSVSLIPGPFSTFFRCFQ